MQPHAAAAGSKSQGEDESRNDKASVEPLGSCNENGSDPVVTAPEIKLRQEPRGQKRSAEKMEVLPRLAFR